LIRPKIRKKKRRSNKKLYCSNRLATSRPHKFLSERRELFRRKAKEALEEAANFAKIAKVTRNFIEKHVYKYRKKSRNIKFNKISVTGMLVVSPRVVKILVSLRVFGTESHPFRCRLVGLSTVLKEIYEKCPDTDHTERDEGDCVVRETRDLIYDNAVLVLSSSHTHIDLP